jgi:uncharacterized membrane protein
MKVVYFLGRLHVVALHVPIGVILMTLLVECLARRERFKALGGLTPVLWVCAAVSAVVTAALGLLHAQEGITGASVNLHRAFGLAFTAAVVCACVLRFWRVSVYHTIQLPLGVVLIVLVTLTGHYGGNITHGSAYLLEHAPAPLRTLAGVESPRPPITDLAQADLFLDVVQPIFKSRCHGCHSEDRTKGGLSLATWDGVMKGGRSGTVIVPGDAQASDLFRRVTLPGDHEDFMPAEGKPPLSDAEKRVIAWWIAAGAPASKMVSNAGTMADDVRTAMLDVVGLAARDEPAVRHAAPPDTIEKLRAIGFEIRPLAVDSPMLDVAFTKGRHIEAPALESLLAIKDQVARLNLRAAGLKDEHLRLIGQFTRLEGLRLELNEVTDAGVSGLRDLVSLRSLNLYGTQITEASLQTLSRMRSLRDVYLFNTKISERAISEARARNAQLVFHKD